MTANQYQDLLERLETLETLEASLALLTAITTRTETRLCKLIEHLGATHLIQSR